MLRSSSAILDRLYYKTLLAFHYHWAHLAVRSLAARQRVAVVVDSDSKACGGVALPLEWLASQQDVWKFKSLA